MHIFCRVRTDIPTHRLLAKTAFIIVFELVDILLTARHARVFELRSLNEARGQ